MFEINSLNWMSISTYGQMWFSESETGWNSDTTCLPHPWSCADWPSFRMLLSIAWTKSRLLSLSCSTAEDSVSSISFWTRSFTKDSKEFLRRSSSFMWEMERRVVHIQGRHLDLDYCSQQGGCPAVLPLLVTSLDSSSLAQMQKSYDHWQHRQKEI